MVKTQSIQIKSRFAVESILLNVACRKFNSLARSSRSIKNGLPAIAPLLYKKKFKLDVTTIPWGSKILNKISK